MNWRRRQRCASEGLGVVPQKFLVQLREAAVGAVAGPRGRLRGSPGRRPPAAATKRPRSRGRVPAPPRGWSRRTSLWPGICYIALVMSSRTPKASSRKPESSAGAPCHRTSSSCRGSTAPLPKVLGKLAPLWRRQACVVENVGSPRCAAWQPKTTAHSSAVLQDYLAVRLLLWCSERLPFQKTPCGLPGFGLVLSPLREA